MKTVYGGGVAFVKLDTEALYFAPDLFANTCNALLVSRRAAYVGHQSMDWLIVPGRRVVGQRASQPHGSESRAMSLAKLVEYRPSRISAACLAVGCSRADCPLRAHTAAVRNAARGKRNLLGTIWSHRCA